MEELPWMKPDFDISKVLAADKSGVYRGRLEDALYEMSHRLTLQRAQSRSVEQTGQIEQLLDAIELAQTVIAAAHDASHSN